ncbi:hypothetical protein BX661DRAFT_177663 [Kickxella alabastrina]|uniref:uncharacterized protein n=1 Tax=Kickxella alabastrina TaxID=61397 RepID=UPI002220AA04|nr:uncharacterized protein BX661DRAFT_177663 [Kickxella alabastrina]KAI7833844.1 hypothetical protein BX661DRAFT_177663 [Kickxella alabastrina]
MWLLNKIGNIQSDVIPTRLNPEQTDIPKHPVFYPPTPKNTRFTTAIGEQPAGTEQRKSIKLLFRLKTIFLPKGSLAQITQRRPHSSGTQQEAARCESKLRVLRRSRLIARSPVREESISPDLHVLAEIECVPRPSQCSGEYYGSPHTLYSSTTFYPRPEHHLLKKSHFTKSVCSPRDAAAFRRSLPADQDFYCSENSNGNKSELSCNESMTEPLSIGLTGSFGCTPRSTSLHLPTRRASLMYPLQENNSACAKYSVFGSRAFRGSGCTTILNVETHTANLCDGIISSSSDISTGSVNIGISPRPSQQTCDAVESLLDERVLSTKTMQPFIQSPAGAKPYIKAPRSLSPAAHRPYSEIFLNNNSIVDKGFARRHVHDMGLVPGYLNGNQTMCIHSACADSSLVQSSFDLAKLLPNAPL